MASKNIRTRGFGLKRMITAAVALGVTGTAAVSVAEMTHAFQPATNNYVVFGYNDLGMHCMQADFSQMMILPPYNVLHAQVIRRGNSPEIMNADVAVKYAIPNNTTSTSKTNFWSYANALMGANLAPDVGLAGKGMSGTMTYNTARRDFEAVGIPITPIDDNGIENPYPLSLITVTAPGGTTMLAQTQAVVPVSWEMSCNICHNTPGQSVATTVLTAHDTLHGTDLIHHQPVMCASCHSDNALGTPGTPGVKSLSLAMHGAHAPRMTAAGITGAQSCYTCHPGYRTTCLRDVHSQRGMDCISCHGDMATVADPNRNPWAQEPSCASCHQPRRPNFEFEQPGTLFRNSVGHMGVQCMSCHGSPHAITPTSTKADNLQALRIQGHTGPIGSAQGCTACHTSQPQESFPHRRSDD